MNKCRESIKNKNNILNNNRYAKDIFDNMTALEHQSNKRHRQGHFDNMEFADTSRIEETITKLEELTDGGHLNVDDLIKLDKYLYLKYKAKLNKRRD